jgi:hypothetical protein
MVSVEKQLLEYQSLSIWSVLYVSQPNAVDFCLPKTETTTDLCALENLVV